MATLLSLRRTSLLGFLVLVLIWQDERWLIDKNHAGQESFSRMAEGEGSDLLGLSTISAGSRSSFGEVLP